jgi:hypothetical protein
MGGVRMRGQQRRTQKARRLRWNLWMSAAEGTASFRAPAHHSGAQFGTRWPAEPGPVPKTPPNEPCLFESLKPIGIRIRVSACPLTRRQKHQPYIDVRTRQLEVAQTAASQPAGKKDGTAKRGRPCMLHQCVGLASKLSLLPLVRE